MLWKGIVLQILLCDFGQGVIVTSIGQKVTSVANGRVHVGRDADNIIAIKIKTDCDSQASVPDHERFVMTSSSLSSRTCNS
jgi:hypothetical protein